MSIKEAREQIKKVMENEKEKKEVDLEVSEYVVRRCIAEAVVKLIKNERGGAYKDRWLYLDKMNFDSCLRLDEGLELYKIYCEQQCRKEETMINAGKEIETETPNEQTKTIKFAMKDSKIYGAQFEYSKKHTAKKYIQEEAKIIDHFVEIVFPDSLEEMEEIYHKTYSETRFCKWMDEDYIWRDAFEDLLSDQWSIDARIDSKERNKFSKFTKEITPLGK